MKSKKEKKRRKKKNIFLVIVDLIVFKVSNTDLIPAHAKDSISN